MFIEVREILIKNFLGVANNPLKYDFTKSKITLFKGTNGSGKSTLLDAICFVLYKTSYRDVNLPLLVNSANGKDTLVEITFGIGSNEYKVRRGIKPNIFEIYRNGELIKQDSTVVDYQYVLEREILGMNYNTFVQTIILGSRSYIPFMKLKAADRRAVIDDIFPVKYIGQMLEALKLKISAAKDRLSDISDEIDKAEIHIEYETKQKELVKNHSEGQQKKYKETIDNISSEITELSDNRDGLVKRLEGLTDRLKAFDIEIHEETFNTSVRASHKIDAAIEDIEEDKKFYNENDRCPSCRQKIDDMFRQKIIENKTKRAEDLLSEKSILEAKKLAAKQVIDSFDLVDAEIKEVRREIKSIDTMILSLQKRRTQAQKELETLLSSVTDQFDYDANIAKYKSQIKTLRKEKNDLDIMMEVYKINQSILKDDGYKAKEIARLLPVLNARITHYLSLLDFPCQFQLDETFNAVVRSRNRDKFVYNSFSEGQKLRIDLSILFAFRSIAQDITSMSSNLLIMDEILDGPFDRVGMNDAMTCIKKLAEASDVNIIMISPKGEDLSDSNFNEIYNFRLVKDVTKMTKEK